MIYMLRPELSLVGPEKVSIDSNNGVPIDTPFNPLIDGTSELSIDEPSRERYRMGLMCSLEWFAARDSIFGKGYEESGKELGQLNVEIPDEVVVNANSLCDATMVEPDDYETKDKTGWLNAKLEDEPKAGLEYAGLISHSSDNEEHVKQAGKDVIRLMDDLGLFLSLKEDQYPSQLNVEIPDEVVVNANSLCDATMVEPDDYETKDKTGWLNAKLEDEPKAGLEYAGLISHSSDNEEHVKQAGKDVIRLMDDLGLFLSLKEDQYPS
ncbi:hypothetical protein DY000_02031116 [Brassica cretica]|uniref:Uncharacterized protein n=1 Tax=Brassica cretica TaxID=69181 RepID=A0ABQ7DMN7_BRACR|nr:hypothetical protein DY000_02031116 [Brassica cretica]